MKTMSDLAPYFMLTKCNFFLLHTTLAQLTNTNNAKAIIKIMVITRRSVEHWTCALTALG